MEKLETRTILFSALAAVFAVYLLEKSVETESVKHFIALIEYLLF
jgi:hypothetical protein